MNSFYLIPTPIGNLKDITLRALEVLQRLDFLVCEDTRTAGRLLKHFNIRIDNLISFNDHNKKKRTPRVLADMSSGLSGGLISESGSPCISDPGFYLVRALLESGITVIPLPGPTALTTGIMASGLPTDSFVFTGFLSKKKGKRVRELKDVMSMKRTAIIYESPYRIDSTLEIIAGIDPERQTVIAREMTKIHEEFIRGTAQNVLENNWTRKGEIVLMITGDSK